MPEQDTDKTLATTTYGVEIERYKLDIKNLEHKKQFVKSLTAAAKAEKKADTKRELDNEDQVVAPNLRDVQTAALCKVWNAEGKLLMDVRLDGEKEIVSLSQQENPDIASLSSGCFKVEFISTGAGIKMHQAFFDDVAKGKDAEIRKITDLFIEALTQASKSEKLSASCGEFTYEFSAIGRVMMDILRDSSNNTLISKTHSKGEHEGKEEMAFHVTHSMPIPRTPNPDYMRALGEVFGVGKEGSSLRVADKELTPRRATDIAFVPKHDPSKSPTGDRNDNQPIFKLPREYLADMSGGSKNKLEKLAKEYIDCVKNNELLEPTSNIVEYVRYDITVYKELYKELTGSDYNPDHLDEDTRLLLNMDSLSTEEQKLGNTIKALESLCEAATTLHQGAKISKIRIFESHDEKLQKIVKIINTNGDVAIVEYRGLLELRSNHPLQKAVKYTVFPESAPSDDKIQEIESLAKKYLTKFAYAVAPYTAGVTK